MTCSPQRFLANNRNLFRTATLTPSSVLPVENKVLTIPYPRTGTARALLTGIYTGFEQADYEVEILDTEADVARVSAPTKSGAGSGTLSNISATGPQQIITIENQVASIDAESASTTIEGATVKAAIEGVDGNAYSIVVDQSGMTRTNTTFTLLTDLEPGQGSTSSPLIGQAYDWNTVAIANGVIPDSALRVCFADDPYAVYLNYKDFASDGTPRYYLIPSLTRTVPKGTLIQTVTGGRTVVVSDGDVTTETVNDVITAFDFLNWVRTQSELLVVTTPVPNDRSPTGIASREFSLRTDAHAGVASGSGSSFAKSFTNVTVSSGAGTQLVTAECIGVTAADHPNARLGSELWQLKSSLLGDLGIIQTGVPFFGSQFGLTIPVRLPSGYGEDKGSIGASVNYVSRVEGEEEPPICVKGLRLGPDASDKTITFRYTARPSGDCNCESMPVPAINSSCLGNPSEGGASVSYQSDTVARLIDLYDKYESIVRDLTIPATAETSAKAAPAIEAPADGHDNDYENQVDGGASATAINRSNVTAEANTPPANMDAERLQGQPLNTIISGTAYAYFVRNSESIKTVVANWEAALALIDPLDATSPPGYREAGNTAWDSAVAQFWDDIDDQIAASSPTAFLLNIPSERYSAAVKKVLMSAGISSLGKADASTVSGDGCWRDLGGSAWWEDVEGVYMPLFTNVRWYLSQKTVDGGVRSTHEATGIINVKCPGSLKYGDEVTIKILNAGWGATYQRGDVIEQPFIAAAPAGFSGGVDGAPQQTWTVHGSVSGPFPVYSFNPESPTAYSGSAGGATLDFLLVEGGIPPAKGDRFRFAIEGGHFRWRKNGGAWDGSSPPLSIPLDTVLLDSGLSLSFTAGAASSFVAGDVHKFRALQPWAVSNVQTPNAAVWKWAEGSPNTATLDADCGSVKTITAFAMLHAIEDGATIELSGGVSAANEWTESIAWREDAVWKILDREARYLRLSITGSGSVQWPWVGEALTTTLDAEFDPVLDFKVNRPSGNLQGGRFVGEAISGDVVWTENALSEADVGWRVTATDALVAMIKEVKRASDQPLIFIPNVSQVDDPLVFARVSADRIQFPGRLGRNIAFERRFAASIPLEGVWR